MTETYTVVGWWTDSNERYKAEFQARTVHDAEAMMLRQAADEDGAFRIAGTLLGAHDSADTYTAFVDPDDEANLERCDLAHVTEDLELGEWTVLGLVTSTRLLDRGWNERTGGERYISREMTTHPRFAEDMARAAVRGRGHFELTVCAVLRGRRNRCEAFPFAQPDQRAAA